METGRQDLIEAVGGPWDGDYVENRGVTIAVNLEHVCAPWAEPDESQMLAVAVGLYRYTLRSRYNAEGRLVGIERLYVWERA